VTARSYLFAPGDQARKLQHALASGADAIIADLEDAVAPSAKANARGTVADWLAAQLNGDQPELWVRVNASSRLLADDVHAVVGPAVTGICVPKPHSAEQVRKLGELLTAAEQQAGVAEGSIKVLPLVESAAGILSAPVIAQEPRVRQLGLGELDLCAEVGIQLSADERELLPVRLQVVLASAAAGLAPPVGPVSTDFRDLVTLRRSTQVLRRLGFGSRWAIHPAQVPVINQTFTPTPEQIDAVRRLVERYDGALSTPAALAMGSSMPAGGDGYRQSTSAHGRRGSRVGGRRGGARNRNASGRWPEALTPSRRRALPEHR
jgi:citrate lyase subunit beta/citryl-CoA lyase